MKARDLIGGSVYGPAALKVMTKAFDDAWSEIAPHFDGDRQQVQSARLRLADAILSVASEHSRDPEQLKNQALEVMALGYRSRPKGGIARN
jgi:hypothetical protein